MNPVMKTAHLCAVAAALVFPVASQADVPLVEKLGRGAVIRCGFNAAGTTVLAVHADKIIFSLSDGLIANDPADQAALNAVPHDTELDIKVLDNPRNIADLRGKVLSFIGAADTAVNRQKVKIIDVEYAMICPHTASPQ